MQLLMALKPVFSLKRFRTLTETAQLLSSMNWQMKLKVKGFRKGFGPIITFKWLLF
jgi:hypothetical protein